MRIIFFGTPEFSAIILEELIKNNFKPVLVVTAPDKPVGRNQVLTPPAVKLTAEHYGIPCLQPESLDLPDFKLVLTNSQPDLIALAAYGPPFLTSQILSLPSFGCLNVHPSLLPAYRGASPIPHAILANEKETGVTVIRLSAKIDRGDILAQERMPIALADTTQTLGAKLARLGGQLLVKTIPALVRGKIKPQPQPEKSPTPYCYQLKKEDGQIDWNKPADYIERQIRAFTPWPGAYSKLKTQNSKLIKILEAGVLTGGSDKRVGEIFLTRDGQLTIKTGQNCLVVKRLQLESGKPMAAEEFLRGHREIISQRLC
jgi:methionyl-tRNA formyltransferase